MTHFQFLCKCLSDILDGLREGLSHFSGNSRAAIIYKLRRDLPFFIIDPQHLLRGHELKIEELYIENTDWLYGSNIPAIANRFEHHLPEKNLQLAGLVSFGGRSRSVFYQMWFTEHHPDICSIGPTERWLEHAAWRFSHDIANECNMYTGISGSFLREYATHAVRDEIVDRMNLALGWDTHLRIFPTLDKILGISRTIEEGAFPRGKLIFIDRLSYDQPNYLVRFPAGEAPLASNYKHVRKLLMAVEQSTRFLVSDGEQIIGIAGGKLPDFFVMADYRGQYGFLNVSGEPICSFSDGRFRSTTHRAKLVQAEEIILESDLDREVGTRLFKTISKLVHYAEQERFGCTIVIDLNTTPVHISGQRLEQPLDLSCPGCLRLAERLLSVDGALHIGREIQLIAFACLLDGSAIDSEDRARGARFNSALRFTAAHRNLFVIVVSGDRPVSLVQEGVENSAYCQWRPDAAALLQPQTLIEWITEADRWNGSEPR